MFYPQLIKMLFIFPSLHPCSRPGYCILLGFCGLSIPHRLSLPLLRSYCNWEFDLLCITGIWVLAFYPLLLSLAITENRLNPTQLRLAFKHA